MIIGIALVVDELHKGQRLVYRYPESVPSNVLNAHEQLLKFHRDYLSLSPDNFAKLFRPKAALFNKVLELTIDDLHYISFPCPCSDELSSDSSLPTSTDVITLFNVVIATVRESSMKALLAKTRSTSEGEQSRGMKGEYERGVKVGTDPVAVALGLGGSSFQGASEPKLLRRVVETVSRALLHQEKRNRYVSKQVTLMLRLQEHNNTAAASSSTIGSSSSSSSGPSAHGGISGLSASATAGKTPVASSHSSILATIGSAGTSGKGGIAAGENPKRRLSMSIIRSSSSTGGDESLHGRTTLPPGAGEVVASGTGTGSGSASFPDPGSTVNLAVSSTAGPSLPSTSTTVGGLSLALSSPVPALLSTTFIGSSPVPISPMGSAGAGADSAPSPAPGAPLATTAGTLAPEKNLQTMEAMQQQCSLANELRQIYHGLVGGHSVNLMVNAALSINIRLHDELYDDHFPGHPPPPHSHPRSHPHSHPHQHGIDHTLSYGSLSFLTVAEKEAMLPLFSSINCTSHPAHLAPLSSSTTASAVHSFQTDLPPPTTPTGARSTPPAPEESAPPVLLHPQLHELILTLDPTLSLDDLSVQLELPLSDVYEMCVRLRDWGMGQFISPIVAERRYRVQQGARTDSYSRAARTFAAVFIEPLRGAESYLRMQLMLPTPTNGLTPPDNLSNMGAGKGGSGLRASTAPHSASATTGPTAGGLGANRPPSSVVKESSNQPPKTTHPPHPQSHPHARMDMSSSVPSVEFSLPCVLSVFDGHRPLEHAVNKLPPPLQPFAVDMVVWLLRWHLLEEVHVYLVTYALTLADIAQNVVVSKRDGAGGASRRARTKSSPERNNSLNWDADEEVGEGQGGHAHSNSSNGNGTGNGGRSINAAAVVLSEVDWVVCSRVWPYFESTAPSSSDRNSYDGTQATGRSGSDNGTGAGTDNGTGTGRGGNGIGSDTRINHGGTGAGSAVHRSTLLPLYEIVRREGLTEDDVVKVVRKLPQYFSIYYC